MKRILGFTGGVIATSVLLSGCAAGTITTAANTTALPLQTTSYMKMIDVNTSKVIPLSEINTKVKYGILVSDENIEIKPVVFYNQNCSFMADVKADFPTRRFETRLKSAICKDNNITYVSDNIKGFVVGDDNITGLDGFYARDLNRYMVLRQEYISAATTLNNEQYKTELFERSTQWNMKLPAESGAMIVLQEGTFTELSEHDLLKGVNQKQETKLHNEQYIYDFALNSIAELKYKKSSNLLSTEEIDRIINTDQEFKYLIAFSVIDKSGLSFDVAKIMVTIASVSLTNSNVTTEDFKNIAAASKSLVAFFDAQKKMSKEQFTTLVAAFKTHFKTEQFTEDKGASFIKNYKF